jgi:hypothetical protein
VYDQRVVGRSALGGKYVGGRGRVEGEGTQAIDGLCWESDDVAFCQELNGSFDGVLCLWIRVDRCVARESDRAWVTFEYSGWSRCRGHGRRSGIADMW